jgi:hypothetical protein
MTEPKPKGGKKKLAGLSPVTIGGVALGALGIFWYVRKKSAAAAAAVTGTTDGQTTPGSGSSAATVTAPTTLSAWIDDALGGANTTATYSNSDLLNDINDWLSGSCVSSQGYTTIGNLVTTLGVPPGYGSTPTLTVCTGSTVSGTLPGDDIGTGTGINTDPAVLAAISAAAGVPSQIISNVAQGQNQVQAANNANDTLPALSASQAAEYLSATGSNYSGPQTLSAAQQSTMPTIGPNGLPVGGDETIG